MRSTTPFERRIEDLHPLLGDVQVAKVASPFRLRARGPPVSVRIVAAQCIGRRLARLAELRRELDELRLCLGEFDLELSRVDPFGLREEDATTQQLELPFELLVRPSKLVALDRDRGERGARPREGLGGRRQPIRRRRQRGLELRDPTEGFFKLSRWRRIDEHDSSVVDALDSVEPLSASCTYLDRTLCAAQCVFARERADEPSLTSMPSSRASSVASSISTWRAVLLGDSGTW